LSRRDVSRVVDAARRAAGRGDRVRRAASGLPAPAAPVIERYLEHGGGFVAVGLGHLLGDDGLLAMLGRAGYRVTREAAP
jgi:hypothetical protein